MAGLNRDIDPDGLLEYSVVFTDRSLNHMSKSFQTAMNDISRLLKSVYNADAVAIVPGGGTYGMEAVARQFATSENVLVIRNGWFSFRWSQIFEAGRIPKNETVLKAKKTSEGVDAPYAPVSADDAAAAIRSEKPAVVFAPHVETSSGIILPDDYIKSLSDAAHEVGALFVLDCIASGAVWVDMKKVGVDVLISAPQKGWSASPCAALVMMSEAAEKKLAETTSSSFACDLKKWRDIMAAYENGGHAYHATMPTDGLVKFRDTMLETEKYGFEKVQEEQWALGNGVRELMAKYQFRSVAAEGFEAPGVAVFYTQDSDIQNGSKFAKEGLQIAAGVPLQCDEGTDFKTFRLGLFGLDKLHNVERSISSLDEALKTIL